ncbi:MAG: hypothetical protein H6729_16605 [Deltaproteobacteria bacterium]|nr:hypothetical protein [Deltaproteobacteria bacterium]
MKGPLALDTLRNLSRRDETGRLKVAALAIPLGLGGPWVHSPNARANGFAFNLEAALAEHANLTKLLLERGVEVYLIEPDPKASEAVYATDVVTTIGRRAVVASPLHPTRQKETGEYTGGLRLSGFGAPSRGPVEFGDVMLSRSGHQLVVLQGIGGWRGTPESFDRLDHALDRERANDELGDGLTDVVHVPVQLSGDGTLHLDYVLNYAGDGASRVMTVCPEGLANPGDVDRLARVLNVSSDRIIRINKAEMLAAAANLASISPTEVVMAKNAKTARVANAIRALGLEVIDIPYEQMTQKDGAIHCSIGQLNRA